MNGLRRRFDPFDLSNDADYRAWRAYKLAHRPHRLDELIVEIGDPRNLTEAECDALRARCLVANMAVYASTIGDDPDKEIVRALGHRLGLSRLDHNWLADEDAVTSLTVSDEGPRPDFVPYTNRPIHWHTDGYYNAHEQQINGLILRCAMRIPSTSGL
jgi:hypothetical protein